MTEESATFINQQCPHSIVTCLNEFEFVRKYRCESCQAIMMCACDEDVGREFLPHQLKMGSEYGTRKRIPVTLGFQPRMCRECRGLSPEAHPMAAIHGRTTKIKRYYWREIWFLTHRLFRRWALDHSLPPRDAAGPEADAARAEAANRALDEIKHLHEANPKYAFVEESQEEVMRRWSVEVIDLHVTYARNSDNRRVQVFDGSDRVPVEEYAARHYQRDGWTSLPLESSPLHVLFGVYMWLVIQDPADQCVRTVATGDRNAFEKGEKKEPIWFQLPEDFGTSAYGTRRAQAIASHLSSEMLDRKNLLWLFDYWLEPSWSLRNYLWAHKDEDVRVARQLVEILPPATIVEILKYLVEKYWGRYIGWPDLIVWRQNEYFLAEVKSSKDKLSDDQKRWIRDNAKRLHLPFRVVKIHKAAVAQ